MSFKIKEVFLGNLKGAERDKFRQEVINSKNVLDKLSEILYNIQESKRDSVLVDYDTPSWSHKQAHLNGEVAMLKKVIELITMREREDLPTI